MVYVGQFCVCGFDCWQFAHALLLGNGLPCLLGSILCGCRRGPLEAVCYVWVGLVLLAGHSFDECILVLMRYRKFYRLYEIPIITIPS